MTDLNITLLNNRLDALQYIKPQTDAEVTLFYLLKDADVDVNEAENKVEDLTETIEDLEATNEALEIFFNKIVKAYNTKLGTNQLITVDDENFLDTVLTIIEDA
jgi:vacuolar-type H+-ATPase subunit I/STV1